MTSLIHADLPITCESTELLTLSSDANQSVDQKRFSTNRRELSLNNRELLTEIHQAWVELVNSTPENIVDITEIV